MTTGWTKALSIVVGSAIVGLYAAVVIAILIHADKPPTVADPVGKNAPRYICVKDATASKPGTTKPSKTTKPVTTPATKKPAARATKKPTSTKSAADAASSIVVTVNCQNGKLKEVKQQRGAYDPNAREMALLAIVAPLITTIFGFLFGARAGAGEAGAQKAELETQQAKVEGELKEAVAAGTPAQALFDSLKAKGLIDQ